MTRSLLRGSLAGGLLTAFSFAGTAHADAPGTPNQPPVDSPVVAAPQTQPPPQQQVPSYRTYRQRRHREGYWYGWQTLIVDGGWIVVSAALASPSPSAAGFVVLGGYALGGPVVHFAHGEVGRGFADLGIRVVAPTLLGLLGFVALGGDGDVIGAVVGAGIGVFLGAAGAIAVDAAALAYESTDDDDEAVHRTPRRVARRPTTSTAPLIAPRAEGGVVLGLSGTLY